MFTAAASQGQARKMNTASSQRSQRLTKEYSQKLALVNHLRAAIWIDVPVKA